MGGSTGQEACVQDCNGEWGGSATIDNCGQCVGGSTGQTACEQDCNGEWGGSAIIDNCNQCVGGSTGQEACVQDCNGEWGGSATIDNCGQCVGGSTGQTACEQDCNGEWGGSAIIDNCNQCVGGSTGQTACTQQLIIKKVTIPAGAPDGFTFEGDAAGEIQDGGSITVGDLQPGEYHSTEIMLGGWKLTAITCDDDNSSGNVETRTATFVLDPGETVTCTFTNEPSGDAAIEKAQTAGETVLPGDTFFYELTIQNSYDGLVDMLVKDTLDEHLDYVAGTLQVGKDGGPLMGEDDLYMTGGKLSYLSNMSGVDLLTIIFEVRVNDLVDVSALIRNQGFVTVFYAGTDIRIDDAESNIVQTKVVPEPATLFFFGIGLFGILALLRRKRR